MDFARMTEVIRRKIKTIVFDRKNRRLSDKMYDELGNFLEKLNQEGVFISQEQFNKLDKRIDKLQELNLKRIDELSEDMAKDTERLDQRIAKQQQAFDQVFDNMGANLTDQEIDDIINGKRAL